MSEGKRGWKWWQKTGLAVCLSVAIALALFCSAGKPWIRPLPGVRVEMSRPPVQEGDLGPDSAYRLLLEAVRIPRGIDATAGKPRIWSGDWREALGKFRLHDWHSEPPPPAPVVPAPRDHPALAADAPWTREQCEDIQRLAQLYEPRLAILDQALAAPDPQMPTPGSPDFEAPYSAGTRNLILWLAVSSHYRAATGDYAGCAQDLDRALGMGNLVSRGTAVLLHLRGMACSSMAADAAWTITTHDATPASALRDMARSFLKRADEAEPFAEALRAEALLDMGMARDVYRDGSLERLNGDGVSLRGRLYFLLARLRGSTPASTQANLCAYYQHLVAPAQKPYSKAVQAEHKAFHDAFRRTLQRYNREPLLARDPVGLVVAASISDGISPHQLHSRFAQRDAILRGMGLFCAIQAYRREHGSLPKTLDQLVPDYLPRVPKDPFGGKPFRYLKSGVPGLPEDAWAVYSIGEDFTDDGGSAHSVGSPRTAYLSNPDLVWPSCPYPPLPEPGGGSMAEP
jgi:hypothetical protein